MQYPAILREIDAELSKLLRVRNILAHTVESASSNNRIRSKQRSAKSTVSAPLKAAKPKRSASSKSSLAVPSTAIGGTASIPESTVTVLPPKQRREYRRTIKAFVPEPRALAAPRSNAVVVYMAPRTAKKSVVPVPASLLASPQNMEAVMRQKLFGGQET